jgi:hypothetical protein
MATIFTDDFETESIGNLNGQNGWVATDGSNNFQVENSVVAHGTQAVSDIVTGVNTYRAIEKTGTAQTDGQTTVYVRMGTNPVNTQASILIESGKEFTNT